MKTSSTRQEGVGAMERIPTTWRASLWARWLGWTMIYTLVAYGIGVFVVAWLSIRVVPDPGFKDVLEWGGVFAPLLLALLIGVWFGSWWWVLGPPVALLLPSLVGLMSASILVPNFPSDLGQGYLLFFFLAVLSLIPSTVGVAIGKAWHYLRRPAKRF